MFGREPHARPALALHQATDQRIEGSYTTGGYVSSSPAIGSDGTIYEGDSYEFYAINSDGTLR
ncbi:hypothetical protein IIA79_06120 [bacterium]|nr:hypothetical protein [bacterium]